MSAAAPNRTRFLYYLTSKPCDVLVCDQRVLNGVDVCPRHADGAPVSALEVEAAGRLAAAELEQMLVFASDGVL